MVLRCAATLSWSHVLMLVLCLSAAEDFHWTKHDRSPFHYGSFPTGFSWAAGSSAYQTEGAWDTGAKGVSNWESFSHKMGQMIHTANHDCSYEGYCKVREDISLLKKLKLNLYCFSLSWAWIFPTRRKADPEKVINHNDAPINRLLENWITPVVTVYHWDLSESISGDEMGEHVPGLKLRGTGPYRVANHIGKAHAKVWHSYNAHWCSAQKGRKSIQQGLVSSRLPAFSSHGKSYIKSNFLGISHFIFYAAENFPPGHQGGCLSYCGLVDPRWPDFEWLYSLPCGIHRLFNCVKTQIINLIIEKTTCPELCGEWMMQYFRESINKMLKDGQLETELLLQSASNCRGGKGRRNSEDPADACQSLDHNRLKPLLNFVFLFLALQVCEFTSMRARTHAHTHTHRRRVQCPAESHCDLLSRADRKRCGIKQH